MAVKKLRVGVLFGGRSGEHEISLLSAASVLKAIDRERYEVVPIGISKDGRWLGGDQAWALLGGSPLDTSTALAGLAPDGATDLFGGDGDRLLRSLDVVFPVLHGTFGEDGTMQGLLEIADVPYVGSGVLGSAAGMDKDVMKKLFAAAGLQQTPYVSVLRREWREAPEQVERTLETSLRYPFFVKPANLGSSVGISKVHDRSELASAMDLAAGFDRKLVVEQGVGGPGAKPRELEVAVLGNEVLEASVVGEIVPSKEFYDYEAKYQLSGPDESVCLIPATLSAAQSHEMRQMAIRAVRACECSGLARVDFLVEPGDREPAILLNEINTMPGFTSISMYPKLWAASGLSYPDLIDRLIALAQERHRDRAGTAFSRE